MLGAAHKPGAIPLRPLTLGDIYDAAFRIIRFNPRATAGSAVLVTAVAMAIPILVTAIVTLAVDLSAPSGDGDLTTAEAIGYLGTVGSIGLGSVLQSIGLVFVTGMVAHVTAAAAVGRRLSLAEAWRATHGTRWRLVGLSVLLGLMVLLGLAAYVALWVLVALTLPTAAIVAFGVVSVPAMAAFACWFWIRIYYLPVPALMIERIGVLAAIRRGYRLTRRQFWRTFGLALLTMLITQVAGGLLSVPFTIGGEVISLAAAELRWAMLAAVVLNALGSVVAAAFVAPFAAAVTSLQYLDQRMRKEAYDVELLAQAGIGAR